MLATVITTNYMQAQFLTKKDERGEAQYRFGAQTGANFTNKKITFSTLGVSESVKTKMQPGFQVGGIVEMDRGIGYVVQFGLLVSSQKCVFKSNEFKDVGYAKDETLSITYLRLPFNSVLKKDLGSITFLASVGIFLEVAVSGKIGDEKIKFGKDKLMPRFDYGLNLGPGLQFGNLQAFLEYNLGFWYSDINSVLRMTFTNGFALNLIYLFGN